MPKWCFYRQKWEAESVSGYITPFCLVMLKDKMIVWTSLTVGDLKLMRGAAGSLSAHGHEDTID